MLTKGDLSRRELYQFMNKTAIVVGMEIMHGLWNKDFHSPPAVASIECPICQQQKPFLSSWHSTIPLGISLQCDGKGSNLLLQKCTLIPEMDLPSLHRMLLSKILSMTYRMTHPHHISHSITTDNKCTSQPKTCSNQGPEKWCDSPKVEPWAVSPFPCVANQHNIHFSN